MPRGDSHGRIDNGDALRHRDAGNAQECAVQLPHPRLGRKNSLDYSETDFGGGRKLP